MIKKIKRKFVLTSLLAVTILLVTILGVVNIVNFTMIANDADQVIGRIITEEDAFINNQGGNPGGDPGMMPSPNDNPAPGGMDPMGPSSPDMAGSMRFIKITFDKNGNVINAVYKLSAVTEEEAIEWAKELLNSGSGWTHLTYRFRTIKNGGNKTVIVVDESRELLPSYRVLIASAIGTIVGVLISFALLIVISKRFVKPIEESDTKQKKFISDAARVLKNPVTIIALENDVIKASAGESESTKSIDKQLVKLNKLTKKMNELIILNDINDEDKDILLSEIVNNVLDLNKKSFDEKGINLTSQIEKDVVINASSEIIKKMIEEIVSNALKYARSVFKVNLKKENSRIVLEFTNDASGLQDGPLDRVFERFYKMNEDSSGSGLGLSFVKEAVKKYNGRVSAKVLESFFILRIEL